jgi:hypothetical protein
MAVSSDTYKLHFVYSKFFLRFGIYDKMSTDTVKMATQKINSHTNVNLISCLVYGLTITSRFVHCHGGQLLAKRHHSITNAITIPNPSMTITNGTNICIA